MVFCVSHFTIGLNSYGFVGTFYRDDAFSYIFLAQNGYPLGQNMLTLGRQWAFFPLFPVSIRALVIPLLPFFPSPTTSLSSLLWAGFLVANISFFVSAYFLFKLTNKIFNSSKIALITVSFYSFYGASSFFSLIESEALFMALALASFYYLEENKLVQASILGFFASLTRSDGFLICIPFLICAFQTKTPQIVNSARSFIEKHSKNFKLLLCSAIVASPYLLWNVLGYFISDHLFPIQIIALNVDWERPIPLVSQLEHLYFMGNWFARMLSAHFRIFDIVHIWSAPSINFETFDLLSIGLILSPIIYFVVTTIRTGLTVSFSNTDNKTMKKLFSANVKSELLSTAKYWGYYAAILYIIFYQSDLSSIFRYSIPLLPIYWVSAKIYVKNRYLGGIIFILMLLLLIIGSYLSATNAYGYD
ncbi:MAG: mannosyltransferase family protein [Candidatus Bathyarchaeia archaeon]|jgi:hypothetical protein